MNEEEKEAIEYIKNYMEDKRFIRERIKHETRRQKL